METGSEIWIQMTMTRMGWATSSALKQTLAGTGNLSEAPIGGMMRPLHRVIAMVPRALSKARTMVPV
jgi:hypothetical protein